ncbi:hypothetical protein PEL8287_02726 [Roseovarius litorisediminis]|uniref:Uncharacterized protein n=1 Tax=Roseovarius litorisediminis TaxID=1312363 RepID=A0A1Y5T262_9RHOB|nr:molybdopterin-binding protein [Roseovarius litorisediminis]SLN52094.1 hypothetical protein PEL8287_02726 [Roseovarius litorisediminis]
MKFGPVAIAQAEGAILAHSLQLPGGRLRKGVVLDAGHIADLQAAGIANVIAARLELDDLHEDEAAWHLAGAILNGAPHLHLTTPFTGRVNLIADRAGVVQLDSNRLNAANAVHPMITVATVPDFQQMAKGGMVATVKIIAYGVPEADVTRAADLARAAIRLSVPTHRSASLIITEIPGGPGDKGAAAIAARIRALDMALAETTLCAHESPVLSETIARARGEIILILTGSATSDAYDTAPQALRLAGGQVERFGMPVDPGNLLFIGTLGDKPVIGLPGCARSPALNGADWVLARVACGIVVTSADIAGMGVGGLLKEIPTRPMPRRGKQG